MANYIDGYTFVIPRNGLETYKVVSKQVAAIWKEHGALDYVECVDDGVEIEGTQTFSKVLKISKDEVVIFGWVAFASRESRDHIHTIVAADPRMPDIIAPVLDPDQLIFDAKRMVYGGFLGI